MQTKVSETQTEVVTVKFQGGIPSSQVAAALKFGLEALPGVDAVHFTGLDGIEIIVDRDRARMQVLLDCMMQAGFPQKAVILCGGTLTGSDLPAATTDEIAESQITSGAVA